MSIPEQPFGFVAGRWVLSLADTPMDSDRAPDYKPLYPGSVIFNNKLSHRVVTDGSATVGIVKTRIEATLNEDGKLTDAEGHEFIALPVGIYSVTFSFGQYSWPNFDIEVTAEHTLNAPLWLPSNSPVPSGPGIVHVVKEEDRIRAEAARIAAEAAAARAESALPPGGEDGQVIVKDGAGFEWRRVATDADIDTMRDLATRFDTIAPKLLYLTNPSYHIPGWDIPVGILPRGGDTYSGHIDHEALHRRTPGKTMYVDPVNGSQHNDGLTWETARDTPGRAALDSNNFGTSEVIVRGGVYTRADMAGIGAAGRPDLIVRAEPGTRPIFTQGDSLTAWTHHEGNVHKVVISNTGIIVDRSIIDADGYPEVLTVLDSLAEVVATPGSAYKPGAAEATGSEVYVHLSDGRVPDADVLVGRATYHLGLSGIDRTEPFSYLFEGVEFWGGQYARLQSAVPGETFIAKDCAWRWANNNGISVVGFSRTILINCEATDNGNDGFNYHKDAALDLTGQVLEIGCTYARNGRLPGSSQNGSTAHEDYKIVRIDCLAHDNPGPQFADVNYAQSLNYGCVARDALGYPDSPGYDFTAPELGGKLILIGGSSTSEVAVRQAGNTVIHNFTYSGAAHGGTPQPYLP